MKEIYISVDVEADGPFPGEYSMTSIGAVAVGTCDLKTREYTRLDATADKNRYYAELTPISANWNSDAMQVGIFTGFDAEQAKTDPTGAERRAYLFENGKDPATEMQVFADWVNAVAEEHDARPVFAAFPLGFDWMFTYWYLCKFAESPFGHSRHLDIKTLFMEKAKTNISRAIKRNSPKHLRSKLPHTHLAVDDAAEQGEWLMNLLLWEGK